MIENKECAKCRKNNTTETLLCNICKEEVWFEEIGGATPTGNIIEFKNKLYERPQAT